MLRKENLTTAVLDPVSSIIKRIQDLINERMSLTMKTGFGLWRDKIIGAFPTIKIEGRTYLINYFTVRWEVTN